MSLTIEFHDPKKIYPKEDCSKFLKLDSRFCELIQHLRSAVISKYGTQVSNRRMAPHIEVFPYPSKYTEEEMLERVAMLEGAQVQFFPATLGKAIVLETPPVEGYGVTHATIAHFKGGVPLGWEGLIAAAYEEFCHIVD